MPEESIQFDSRNFDEVRDMNKPQFRNLLQQLLCAMNWMRNTIPEYSWLVQSLQDTMEKLYNESGGITTVSVKN